MQKKKKTREIKTLAATTSSNSNSKFTAQTLTGGQCWIGWGSLIKGENGMLKTGFLVDRQRAWCIHKLIDVEQLQIHMQIALFMACIWNAQKLSPDRNVFESFECFECFEWRCQMSCKWRVSLYLCLIPLLSKFSSIDWFATVGNNFGADQSICYTRNDIFYSCFFFFFEGTCVWGSLYMLCDFISGLSTIVSQLWGSNATNSMALTMKHLFFIRWLASKSAIRSVKLMALAVGMLTANFVYSAYVFCTLKKSRHKKGGAEARTKLRTT